MGTGRNTESDVSYEAGREAGYDNYRAGGESMFFCGMDDQGVPCVKERLTRGGTRVVEANELDYARGFIDGFCNAEADSH